MVKWGVQHVACEPPAAAGFYTLAKIKRRDFITIKEIAYYVKNTTTIHVYWYLIVATCSGLSLDHLQEYVHM